MAVETEDVTRAARRPRFAALVTAARPLQWTKNLLLFAGVLFAAELGDGRRLFEAALLFAAYSLASSAAYLVNDVRDLDHDRRHPVKSRRPIAAGELEPAAAIAAAVALAGAAAVVATAVEAQAVLLLAGFAALQLAYSFGVKHVPLVDVFAIAGLFVIRAVAGATGVDVEVSPWLVVCTGLLALFLGLCKRRAELVLLTGAGVPSRPALGGYSLELIDQLIPTVAAATIASYSIYTFTGAETEGMMLTIPFVVYGLFRYLLLVHQQSLGEEPERVLVTDPWIVGTVALWALAGGLVLALA